MLEFQLGHYFSFILHNFLNLSNDLVIIAKLRFLQYNDIVMTFFIDILPI